MIIAIANQKGGVGKTTLTIHLAAGAARAGKKVLVVDADPQGNATSWLMDGEQDEGLYRLLMLNDPPTKHVAWLQPWGLGLLAGNYRTGEALTMLASVGKLGTITQRIKALARGADLVLIDMPPSRMAGFMEILQAADGVIVPTQLERLSLEGVALLAQTVGEMPQGPQLLGIVPNMCRGRTREHQAQMDELIKAFGASIWPPIPLTIRVTEAASFGKTLFDHCPGDEAARAMALVIRRMLEVING